MLRPVGIYKERVHGSNQAASGEASCPPTRSPRRWRGTWDAPATSPSGLRPCELSAHPQLVRVLEVGSACPGSQGLGVYHQNARRLMQSPAETLPSAPTAQSLPVGRTAWEATFQSGARLLSVRLSRGTSLTPALMVSGSGTLPGPSPVGPPGPEDSGISSALTSL